jgi:hypothetical protein
MCANLFLGGQYTTVEGLLTKIKQQLIDNNPFFMGDSSHNHHFGGGTEISGTEGGEDTMQPYNPSDARSRYASFLRKLDAMSKGQILPFTLVIRDPMGNSFISAVYRNFLPPELDTALKFEDFVRTFEENEDNGLNDINTGDDYGGASSQGPVLADRLTQHWHKTPDHPMPFAQGGYGDNTPNGWANPHAQDAGASSASPEKDIASPEDVSIAFVAGRHFSDDSSIAFMPYEEFSGEKVGYVFRLGSKGLGYYEDVRNPTKLISSGDVSVYGRNNTEQK